MANEKESIENKLNENNIIKIPNINYIRFQSAPSQNIDIGFKRIIYTVTDPASKEKKSVLKDVSGLFKSGELTAIMGPSGAGKSSLLNVLSGFIKKGVNGRLYLNGIPVDIKKAHTKSHSAYMMQEDYFNPLFTVREIMEHASNLKLGNSFDRKTKLQLIDDLLDTMGISKAIDTMCGRLSGGQKKRLNVCLELIDNPPVLFLDEPTSGLDSTNCRLLITKLKELAGSGRTVICTIHQPSAFILSLFDHLYLLESGRTVYQGDTSNLLPFLNFVGLPCPIFHNPADFVMDVVTGEFGCYTDKLIAANTCQNWRKDDININPTENSSLVLSKKRRGMKESPSECFRYRCLVVQLFKHLHRDWVVTYLKCILHVGVAVLIGLIFYDFGQDGSKVRTNTVYLFVTSLYISFTTLMPAALKFPSYLLVLKKEHFNNWYKFKTFFLAFLTVDIPVQIILTCIFFVITYWMTGQIVELWRCVVFTATIALETIIADMFGLMLGSAKNPVHGIFIGTALLIFVTMLGGYFVPLKDLTGILKAFSSLSFFRYTFELKTTAVYGHGRPNLNCPDEALYCHVRNPKLVFDHFGLEEDSILRDMIILAIYCILVMVVAFLCLRYKLKTSK